MASTLAASAYFLTCCRPIHNSFCFLVEKPKLINFYHYPFEFFLKHPDNECKYDHDNFVDHNLNSHNKCTDDRAWSLDDRQQRQHFHDLIIHRIPHCCPDDDTETKGEKPEKSEKKKKPEKKSDTSQISEESTLTPDQDRKAKDKKKGKEDKGKGKGTSEGEEEESKGKEQDAVVVKVEDGGEAGEESEKGKGKDEGKLKSPKGKDEEEPEFPGKDEEKPKSPKDVKKGIDAHSPDDGGSIASSERSSEGGLPTAEKSKEKIPKVKSETGEPDPSKSKDKDPTKLKSDPSVKSTESENFIPSEKSIAQSVKSEEPDDIGLGAPESSEESVKEPKVKSGKEPKEKSGKEPKEKSGKEPKVKSEKGKPSKSKDPKKLTSEESEEESSEPSVKSTSSHRIGLEAGSEESVPKDVVDLTDELIEKLDRNLRNLESTFDKFVKKNKDFIQNLVACLDFEKQKQKSLEDDYSKLKQENEELKTQNDYLKMVNNKQLDLFKNELDRGISENKVIYKRKIHLMERQLQNDQNELQMYKQTEKKYMEVVEQDNEKIEKLNAKVEDLKNKEVQLVKNYLQLLKFLQNVKNILSSTDAKEIPQLRSLNTMTDSEGENGPDVKRVLRNALSDGISTLNVRDLSILHDAIEEVNGGLCHQTEKCTKSPTAASSYPDFTSMSIHRLIIEESTNDVPKGYETTSDQSIDRIPTKQKPGSTDRRVSFGGNKKKA